MPISALQVAGVSPSESRSCDYISPPCIYVFRTTLYFYFYMASSIHMMIMMMMMTMMMMTMMMIHVVSIKKTIIIPTIGMHKEIIKRSLEGMFCMVSI